MRSPRLHLPSCGNLKALFLNPERTATPVLHLLKKQKNPKESGKSTDSSKDDGECSLLKSAEKIYKNNTK